MKTFKNAVISAICIICMVCSASAEGAPRTQFGFKGWPYRNSVPCARVTAAPTRAPQPARTPRPTASQRPASRPTAAPTATVSVDVGDYTTLSVSMQEYSAWNLLNADREANGKAALPLDEELCALARIKSRDMKENRYFAHTSPTFGTAAEMLTAFGYAYRGVGENIAHHATVEKSEAAFMSSANHRANILGSQWKRVGIGIWEDDQGFVYVTQLFAR